MSESKMEGEMSGQINEVSAVTQTLHWTVVVKRELGCRAKLLI